MLLDYGGHKYFRILSYWSQTLSFQKTVFEIKKIRQLQSIETKEYIDLVRKKMVNSDTIIVECYQYKCK